MSDEPRHHPLFLIALGLTALATVPVLFTGREPRLLLGLPEWLWWSGGATVALSALTAFGLLRYWSGDDE